MNSSRTFILLFVSVTLLEMLGDTLAITWLHYVCKPLIMGLLLVYVWQRVRAGNFTATLRWLTVGMVFALLGDVFLMIREVDLFALGLGSFWLSMRERNAVIRPRTISLTAIPFVLYDGVFLFLLKRPFFRNPDLTPLWWPVVAYVFCLSLMGILAFLRSRSPRIDQVAIGAVLFILSDSAIAVDKFLQPVPAAIWIIMTTYVAAQYLIVTGVVEQEQSVAHRVSIHP